VRPGPKQPPVEADHSDLQRLSNSDPSCEILGVDVGDQSVLCVVRLGDRLLFAAEGGDRGHWTKDLLTHDRVAVLSTDGVARKPGVVALPGGGESIAIHSVGLLALTFDHRAIDGAYAARFLNRVEEIITTRDWAAEL
jgi:hypothetical protein